jgi:hypothetical protein
MAQTIQIKRSTGSSAPSSLANGELAYLHHGSNKKLYIGDPGGASGDISVIGGKDFTDKLDLIGAANGTNAADASVVASANNLGVIRIGAGLSIATNGEVSADEVTATSVTNAGALMDSEVTNLAQVKAFDSSDYATSAQGTLATDALPKAGGTLTGALNGTSATFSGELTADSLNLLSGGTDGSILNVDTIGCDQIIGDADNNTSIKFAGSETIEFRSNGDLEVTIDESCLKLRTGTSINEFSTDVNLAGDSDDAVPTEKAVKAYVDASVPTSVATATTATNVTLSADNSTNASHFIPFANSATGNQGLQTDNALSYNPSTNGLSVGTTGNIATGTLSVYSTISGPSTLYIDPSPDDTGEVGGSTTDTGTVVILGDLRVTGETTTVNSTTVSVGDNEIVLNGDHTGTPTLDAGLRVERGSLNDAFFNWDESEDSWVVGEGQSSSPYFYTLLHSNNFETVITTIDGGTFS